MHDNRRKYYRHQFATDLCGELAMIKVSEQKVSSKTAYICIRDIGAGGLRFESHLKFPIRSDVIYEITTLLLGKKTVFKGYLSRINEKTNGFYEYGLQLVDNNDEVLAPLINEISMKSRKTLRNTGCSLCSSRTRCHKANSEFKNPVD